MRPSLALNAAYAWLERLNITYTQSISVIAAAIFLRTFAENFVNANNGGTMNGFIDTFFHYPLWFACVFMCAMLILIHIGRIEPSLARTIVTIASFGILVPPTIDFLTGGFAAQTYDFIIGSAADVTFHFFTLIMFLESAGIGIKLEICAAIIGMFVSVFWRTKSVLRGVLASFLLYSSIFFFAALPIVGVTLHHIATPASEAPLTEKSISEFYLLEEPALSGLWPRPVIIDKRSGGGSLGTSAYDHFSLSMSALLVPIFTVLLAWLYAVSNPKKWKAVVRNFRYTRLLLYLLLAGFGVFLGLSERALLVVSLGDVLAIFMLGCALVFTSLFLIWENDEEDTRIDRITNASRPLASGEFSAREWSQMKWTFLALALVSAMISGWYVFTLIALTLFTYHLYSCPPLRLKRIPVLSSAIVAGNALVAVVAGYFLVAGNESLAAFSSSLALSIFIVVFLAENVKNMKDVAGDKADGVWTLPVLLGERYGPHAVALLASLSVLIVPLLLHASFAAIVLAVVFAPVVYALIIRKPFKELPVFIAFLLFFVLFFLLSLI